MQGYFTIIKEQNDKDKNNISEWRKSKCYARDIVFAFSQAERRTVSSSDVAVSQ